MVSKHTAIIRHKSSTSPQAWQIVVSAHNFSLLLNQVLVEWILCLKAQDHRANAHLCQLTSSWFSLSPSRPSPSTHPTNEVTRTSLPSLWACACVHTSPKAGAGCVHALSAGHTVLHYLPIDKWGNRGEGQKEVPWRPRKDSHAWRTLPSWVSGTTLTLADVPCWKNHLSLFGQLSLQHL